MECKHYKNVDVEDDAPTLYSLLSSSKKVTKKTIEIVLEQVRTLCGFLFSWSSINICP